VPPGGALPSNEPVGAAVLVHQAPRRVLELWKKRLISFTVHASKPYTFAGQPADRQSP